ncbi:unnamed protein product, partial [marine sediment metagenome]
MTAEGYTYAHWKLNESSGTNVPDTSGNSRNGTCTNMEDGDWVAGKLNNCLYFDGAIEYVAFGVLSWPSNISVEAWINMDTVSGLQVIIAQRTSSKYQFLRLSAENFNMDGKEV